MGYGLWSTEKNEREERVGDAESKPRGGGGCLKNVILGLRLRKEHLIYTCFFFNVGLVEPVRFGSIGFRL